MPHAASIPSRAEDRLWTADEFLDWLEPGKHADLIDGEKYMHSPVNLKQARLLNFFDRLLGTYVEQRKLGEVYRETVAVRISPRNVFLPDICFFTYEQVMHLLPTQAPFAPAFVAEALSPGDPERDLVWKFPKYEEHGVRENWIFDPSHLRHQFFRREGELLVEFAKDSERIDSASIPGFWIKRAWLNPDQLPDVTTSLREILGAL